MCLGVCCCCCCCKVGYGDIHPITELEHYVCILFMLLGGVTWAYLIGVLTSIVTNLDRHGTYFKQVASNFDKEVL